MSKKTLKRRCKASKAAWKVCYGVEFWKSRDRVGAGNENYGAGRRMKSTNLNSKKGKSWIKGYPIIMYSSFNHGSLKPILQGISFMAKALTNVVFWPSQTAIELFQGIGSAPNFGYGSTPTADSNKKSSTLGVRVLAHYTHYHPQL
ncbi:hypothetical protein M0802_014580 [Mischocyttarus mexicanus]|nr:hypothetical protein M0802_014581 [Mischocyttarus mexicanus]KAI4478119.1 hypothetical protein M0802_014580 [Mischocyttarus mexicanus]